MHGEVDQMLVQQYLENSALRTPGKRALICGERSLTYGEINDYADQLASSLINIGIKRQDRVVLFMENSPEAVISLFGILKAGAVFVILNPQMKRRKLGYILKDSGARCLLTHASKARIVADATSDSDTLEHIIWIDHDSSVIEGYPISRVCHHSWDRILSDGPASVQRLIDVDLATIIYTSGSTGFPKGVMSAHYNMVAAIESITQYLENVHDDTLPGFHELFRRCHPHPGEIIRLPSESD